MMNLHQIYDAINKAYTDKLVQSYIIEFICHIIIICICYIPTIIMEWLNSFCRYSNQDIRDSSDVAVSQVTFVSIQVDDID